VIAAIGGEEEGEGDRIGRGTGLGAGGDGDQVPDVPPDRAAARLGGQEDLAARGDQAIGEPAGLGRLPGPVQPLQRE
jgi:hypothetical protein